MNATSKIHRLAIRWPSLRLSLAFLLILASFLLLIGVKTSLDLRPLPASLLPEDSETRKPQVFDRNSVPLSVTYQNRWNTEYVPLHDIPGLVQSAFVQSEDRSFYRHSGVDWLARFHALVQNIKALRGVRGASTITEQVVRMLHPRPRTVWSRWIEGIEAARLESLFSKSEILEFYLNEVPYGHQRRGVVQAARFYFDRDPDTLSPKESLALAVLVRAPSSMDPRQEPQSLEKAISRLADLLLERKLLNENQYRNTRQPGFEFARSNRFIEATHFVRHVLRGVEIESSDVELGSQSPLPPFGKGGNSTGRLVSTLDGQLQQKVQSILNTRLEALRSSEVGNGAVLVVDHVRDEVLAWVSGGACGGDPDDWIDGVTTPRQPGSTLKPFLYALAMEMGWTPATIIADAPMVQPVGSGLHNFHNYSRVYYGPLRLRDALGNSLNTPAIRTIQFTGTEKFLEWLRLLGFTGLDRSSDYYGQGLALGDGEVSLFELVRAYSVLARGGEFHELRLLPEGNELQEGARKVIGERTASLITDILCDPQARRLEFGEGHIFRFPVRTAVKTGTSTDHKDSWAIGFTDRHTVGVWMGNLDRRPTRGITGAIGPALVLRAVFAELNRYREPGLIPVDNGLKRVCICSVTGLLAGPQCPRMDELFEPERVPVAVCPGHDNRQDTPRTGQKILSAATGKPAGLNAIRLTQPTPNLQLAIDPRIPRDLQAFAVKIPDDPEIRKVEWIIDDARAGETGVRENKYLWPIERGTHSAKARIWRIDDSDPVVTPEVVFVVK
jgi:penicillin-binding protein 1C